MDWMLNISIFVLELFGLAAIYSVALLQEGSDFLAAKTDHRHCVIRCFVLSHGVF